MVTKRSKRSTVNNTDSSLFRPMPVLFFGISAEIVNQSVLAISKKFINVNFR